MCSIVLTDQSRILNYADLVAGVTDRKKRERWTDRPRNEERVSDNELLLN